MAIAKDLVSGILSGNINTSATNIIVSIGEGLSSSQITGFFPPAPFYMTIMPKSPTIGVANSFDSEVVKVTAVAADQSGDASLTVVRGQYDTTAKSFDSGAIVTLGVYAEDAVFKSDDVLPPAEAWVGSDDIKANAVKASNIDFATLLFGNYSLDEIDTGFTWVDGKHIYKKTYIQECNSGNSREIDISSLNIDTFLPMQVEGGWGGYGNINWPYYVSSGDNGRVFKNGNTLQFAYAFPDYNNRNVIVTIYYTKTS